MIEQLLPTGVVAVEAFEDMPGEPVFPGEEDLVANVVEVAASSSRPAAARASLWPRSGTRPPRSALARSANLSGRPG